MCVASVCIQGNGDCGRTKKVIGWCGWPFCLGIFINVKEIRRRKKATSDKVLVSRPYAWIFVTLVMSLFVAT